METRVITQRICLESRYLTQDIHKHILTTLSNKLENECTQEYGYVLCIQSLEDIFHHKIGRADGGNVFTVRFKAQVMNPLVGKQLLGEVILVIAIGIFVSVLGKQKVLIPAAALSSYTYSEESDQYVGKSTISVGDSLNVVITGSKYNSKGFSCLGVLKDIHSP